MISNVKLYETENDQGLFEYQQIEEKYFFDYPCSNDFSNCKPYQIDIQPGRYLFQVWGAQGGNTECPTECLHNDKIQFGGFGGYSQSVYYIKTSTRLYLYIGAQPNTNSFGHEIKGGYNGGGDGGKYGGGGGGASDIRTTGGEWNENLEKRIIVAGGGGGDRMYVNNSIRGGNGGGLVGEKGFGGAFCISCYGSTLTNTCEYDDPTKPSCKYNEGVEGIGASKTSDDDGGGGGYIGGGASYNAAGGGGSGFIGSTSTIISTQSKTVQSTHEGHGKIIITFIDNKLFSCEKYRTFLIIPYFLLIVIYS